MEVKRGRKNKNNKLHERDSPPKNENSLINSVSFKTCITYFLLSNIKEDILKNVGLVSKQFLFPLTSIIRKTKIQ